MAVLKSEDIAKLAGVSRATVSKVINNYPDVKDETRKRVLDVIRECRYTPDFSARVLAGGKTNTIGFFMNVDSSLPKEKLIFDNNYYSPLLNAVIDRANSSGYYVTVNKISKDDGYDIVKSAFEEKRIDAAILVSVSDDMLSIASLPYPMVFISHEKKEFEEKKLLRKQMACVSFNSYTAYKKNTQFLIDRGYRKIGMIYADVGRYICDEKYRGFMDAMKENSLEAEDKFMIDCKMSPRIAAEKINTLLENKRLPEVFACINDDVAIAVMERISSFGLKIPRDIAIIGFDDTPFARYTLPPLTTCKLPIIEMACKAVSRAIEIINKNGKECTEDIFEAKPVYRKTTV